MLPYSLASGPARRSSDGALCQPLAKDFGSSCVCPGERLPVVWEPSPEAPAVAASWGARRTPLQLGTDEPAAGHVVPLKLFPLGAANQKQIYSLSVKTVKSRNAWLAGRRMAPNMRRRASPLSCMPCASAGWGWEKTRDPLITQAFGLCADGPGSAGGAGAPAGASFWVLRHTSGAFGCSFFAGVLSSPAIRAAVPGRSEKRCVCCGHCTAALLVPLLLVAAARMWGAWQVSPFQAVCSWEQLLAATGLILPAVGGWWGSVGAQSQLDPSDRGWFCWDGTTNASPPAPGSSTARRGLLCAPPDIIWQDLVRKEANQVNVLALPGLLGHTRV